MSSINPNQAFNDHLTSIREAKHRATQILDITNPGHHEAEASLALAWETLFDTFCKNPSIDLPTLNTISSIIHKLTAAYTQIKSLEIKSRELAIKEQDHQTKKDLLDASSKKIQSPPSSLSLETIELIEQQLKLL